MDERLGLGGNRKLDLEKKKDRDAKIFFLLSKLAIFSNGCSSTFQMHRSWSIQCVKLIYARRQGVFIKEQ